MGKDRKALCCYKKDEVKEKLDELKELVKEPTHICKKCARASNEKDRLCKPEKL